MLRGWLRVRIGHEHRRIAGFRPATLRLAASRSALVWRNSVPTFTLIVVRDALDAGAPRPPGRTAMDAEAAGRR